MADSAPLLDQTHNENGTYPVRGETTRFSGILRLLKFAVLLLSVVTLGLLVANRIVINVIRNGTYGYYTWGATNATEQLAIFILVSIIFSAINIAVAVPIVINFIIDVVLASGVLAWAISLVNNLPNESWCKPYTFPGPRLPGPPEETPPNSTCEDLKITVRLLMIIAGSLGIGVGAIYIAQAIIRIISIIRSKFWKSSTWSLPGGEITFQVSLKITGQERTLSADQGQEEGSSTGRGPLHL